MNIKASITKLKQDLLQTKGKWDGAKLTGWSIVGSTLAMEIHRVIFQHMPPNFPEFAGGMGIGGTLIAGGHYFNSKSEHQFGGDPKPQDFGPRTPGA